MSRLSLLTIVYFFASAFGLLTVLLQSADGAAADVGDHILQRDAATDPIPGLWFSDLFYRALANFTLRRADGMSCCRQSALYEAHLSNHTSWTVRMGRLPGPSTTKYFEFGNMHTGRLFGVGPTDISTKRI
eukprot:XP_016661600.1 PREDICTED: uncharacterized protein LOC107884316 [Acyrthosiphon pisum]